MGAMRTVSRRRTIAAPIDAVLDWLINGNNWSDIPGMFYSRVRPVDGPEPFGVGSIREFASSGSKVTEVVTAFERPHSISYQALSTVPPAQHSGGSVTLQEVPGGTEVLWTTSFRLKSPVLAGLFTRLYAPLFGLGIRMVLRTAERALTSDQANT
ncbi:MULTISPECIES: SRPBCC family protein [Mycobacterium]|uniref:SRPBCC family protein n=1 Tax=Mycobacterium TaxID=1763 RepID=UPI0019386A9B|nr:MULTISPECIES: SRPBCC family protein [Mycobacterium]WSE49409.1 SRPBCC family protein [Mycobacterium sp. 2-64]BCO89195.1 hypothetical protein MINTM015_24520 [Mycobacterium paraintracellulare]